MLDKIFWIVLANKIRLFIQNNSKWKFLFNFYNKYIRLYKNSNIEWKYYLITWPLFNIFIFSWFFPFLIILISNFIIIIKVLWYKQ